MLSASRQPISMRSSQLDETAIVDEVHATT
jgi:hypothetical protein